MDTDESMYHATPQTKGKAAHAATDNKSGSHKKEDLLSLPVYSNEYGLMGKIDIYRKKEKKLIERKYRLKNIYQGQIYQLWAQMVCMEEMGYEIDSLAFYEISSNKMIPIDKPTETELEEFKEFITNFKNFNPGESYFTINPNKCKHCIYCNICDKTEEENVYG